MKRWTQNMMMGAALVLASAPAIVAAPQIDTEMVSEQVRKEIVTLPFYSIFDNVEFNLNDQGTLELKGEVFTPVMKRNIERASQRVAGVNTVVNNIEVLPLSPYDNRIRVALVRQLFGNQMFTRYSIQSVPPIHIVVKNGHVTLEGLVNSEMEKNVANIVASGIHGVFSVTNNLRTERI